MTELGKLIASAKRANHGRSLQAAADIATKAGHPISKSYISAAAKGVESITPQLVRGIAAGYGVAQEDVIRAALVDLGFAMSDYNPTAEAAIRRDPDLSSEAKDMLLSALAVARGSVSRGVRRRLGEGAQWRNNPEVSPQEDVPLIPNRG